MRDDPAPPSDPVLAEALGRLERRLMRLEEYLDLPPLETADSSDADGPDAPASGTLLVLTAVFTGLACWIFARKEYLFDE